MPLLGRCRSYFECDGRLTRLINIHHPNFKSSSSPLVRSLSSPWRASIHNPELWMMDEIILYHALLKLPWKPENDGCLIGNLWFKNLRSLIHLSVDWHLAVHHEFCSDSWIHKCFSRAESQTVCQTWLNIQVSEKYHHCLRCLYNEMGGSTSRYSVWIDESNMALRKPNTLKLEWRLVQLVVLPPNMSKDLSLTLSSG